MICDWLILPNIMFSRCLYIVALFRILFPFKAYAVFRIFFIHLSVNGYFDVSIFCHLWIMLKGIYECRYRFNIYFLWLFTEKWDYSILGGNFFFFSFIIKLYNTSLKRAKFSHFLQLFPKITFSFHFCFISRISSPWWIVENNLELLILLSSLPNSGTTGMCHLCFWEVAIHMVCCYEYQL